MFDYTPDDYKMLSTTKKKNAMRYSSLRGMDVSNGTGVGVALFTQGCRFHCPKCFNQNLWDFEGGHSWEARNDVQVLNMLADSHVQRFSILGGEPLEPENLENLYTLIQKIKSVHPHIKIWLYTGNTTEKIFDPKNEVSRENTLRKWIWRTVDIVVDGQYIDAQRDPSLDYRGSANQRIIDVKKSIESGHIITIDSFRM